MHGCVHSSVCVRVCRCAQALCARVCWCAELWVCTCAPQCAGSVCARGCLCAWGECVQVCKGSVSASGSLACVQGARECWCAKALRVQAGLTCIGVCVPVCTGSARVSGSLCTALCVGHVCVGVYRHGGHKCMCRALCVCVCAQPPCASTSPCTADVCACARVCASLLSSAGWSKPGAHVGHVHARLVPLARGTERAGPSWCCVAARCRCPQRALRSSGAHRPLTEQWHSTCKARECQPSCVHTRHGCTPVGALP